MFLLVVLGGFCPHVLPEIGGCHTQRPLRSLGGDGKQIVLHTAGWKHMANFREGQQHPSHGFKELRFFHQTFLLSQKNHGKKQFRILSSIFRIIHIHQQLKLIYTKTY
jgi:hypothetical protein